MEIEHQKSGAAEGLPEPEVNEIEPDVWSERLRDEDFIAAAQAGTIKKLRDPVHYGFTLD